MTMASTDHLPTKKWTRPVSLAALMGLVAGLALISAQPAHAAGAEITDNASGITYKVYDDPVPRAVVINYNQDVGGTSVEILATVTHEGNDYPVTLIANDAFASSNLTTVTIPDSVTRIGAGAFMENDLTAVAIPDSVTNIGHYAFQYNSLATVTIPDSVTTIGLSAFSNNNLTALTIPDSVTTISFDAFSSNNLTTVTIPDSVTTIGGWAFMSNDLTTVTIPDAVTTIGERAFMNNDLTAVTIGNSVTSIHDYAFYRNDLTAVTIPDSVTTIGRYAFDVNPLLSTVVFEGDAPSIRPAQPIGSFGEAQGKTLCYHSEATGFDTSVWEGYQTELCHTVTFDANGGIGATYSQTAPPSSALILNSFTRDLHDFTGWNTEPAGTGEPYSDGDTYDFTADVTLYAQWAAHAYAVTFDTGDGSVVGPAAVNHGATLSPPDDPTRDGHTFTGWYTDQEATLSFDFDTVITDDVTLHAGWDLNTYTVTFDTGPGTDVAATSVDHGTTLGAPANPSRGGYIFTGWYADAEATDEYDFGSPVTEDLTLYAGWELHTYLVNFDTGDGSVVGPAAVDHGDTATAPTDDPTLDGYTFTGWYADAEATDEYDFRSPVTEDLTLYAGWETMPVAVVAEEGTDADQLATTGGTLNSPAFATALLATFTGAALLLYRRWVSTTS